jgi:hypothetical protein
MMPHSIFFTAGPGQSLPLWVSSGAIGPANRLTKALEGSASKARQFCDCGPDPEEFCERSWTDPRVTGYRIAPRALLRLATVPGRFFLRFYRRQAWLHPVADLTSHKVGDIKSCFRQRRRLRQSAAPSGRPNRAPIEPADSRRMQWRNKASTMTGPAYQRQGCSQSGNRLIVWPQTRHRKRRIQMMIQPVSTIPRTWREYMPCPTNCKTPSGRCEDLTTKHAILGTKIFARRTICAPCAELLDSSSEAM